MHETAAPATARETKVLPEPPKFGEEKILLGFHKKTASQGDSHKQERLSQIEATA